MATDPMEKRLVEGLQEIYCAEQQLVDALETLSDQTEDEAASQAFSEHREETQTGSPDSNGVRGARRGATDARRAGRRRARPGTRGVRGRERRRTLDRYNIAAWQRTERYEITAYGNLTSIAGKLGYDEAADPLEETLREEGARRTLPD